MPDERASEFDLTREIQMTVSEIELLTSQQAADRLQISLRLLCELQKTGRIRATRIGRLVRFTPQALAEFIASVDESL